MRKIYPSLSLLIFLFLIVACQKEEIVPQENPETAVERNDVSVEVFNVKDIKDNQHLQEALEVLESHNKKRQRKEMLPSGYGFTINTEVVKYIEKEGYHSYSFPVTREGGDGNIENLLLSLNSNGGYNAFLVKYGFDRFELEAMDKTAISATTTQFKPINFDYSMNQKRQQKRLSYNSICVEEWSYLPIEEGQLSGCPGSNAPCPLREWVLTSRECTWVSSGGGGDGGTSGGTGDTGDGTGGGGSGTDSDDGDKDCYTMKKTAPCGDDPEIISGPVLEPWTEEEETEYFNTRVFITAEFSQNECLKSVYDAMGKASTFEGYLKNFDGDMSVANLRFGYDVNFSSNYDPKYWGGIAITNSPENYLVQIDFNGDPALSSSIHGKPKLIIATSFIHEIIHAEMYRKMLAVAQQPDLNFTQWYIKDPYSFENFKEDLKYNFFGVWDYYTRYEWEVPPGEEPSSPQHQQMAENYRNTIISAISEYDNYQHPPSFYEAISWYGLMGTGNYDPATGLYEDSTAAWILIDEDPNLTAAQERINIRNTITNFQQNDTNKCN